MIAVQISCGGDSSGPNHTAASIAANSSTSLAAAPGTQITELPSVIVRDQSGNPIGGVPVIFNVTAGGGTITGGNTTSNSSGIATVGSWTLGASIGTNTLTATTGGLPAVVFTADGSDPCTHAAAHALGSTSNGQLSAADCKLGDGSFIDFYSVAITTAGTYVFTETGSFDTYLALLTSSSGLVGVNDDFGSASTSSIKAILPAGTFILGANAYEPNVGGTYTLTSVASTAAVSNCEDVFLIPGSNAQESLQTSDCTANGIYSDDYIIFLSGGASIIATMSSSAVDSYLQVYSFDTQGNLFLQTANDNIDGTTQDARVSYTAPVGDFYVIKARSANAAATGAYSLSIQ
jgi:hypothetical protein